MSASGFITSLLNSMKRLDAMLLDLDKKQNSKKDVDTHLEDEKKEEAPRNVFGQPHFSSGGFTSKDTCRKVLMSVGVGHKSETDTTWTCAFLEVSVLLSLKYLVICSEILTLQPRIQSLQTG
ncbi:hypothetical protein ACSBR1_015658 [Camellia fascicularis]